MTTDAFGSGGVKGSKLFRCTDANLHPYNNRTALVAFPNDRAESIRPSEHNKEFRFVLLFKPIRTLDLLCNYNNCFFFINRTIFKRIKRYNYVDPDYAYDDEEMRLIKQHKDIYQTLIRKQHSLTKISKLNSKFANFEDDLNLGIIPGNGLVPPKLFTDQINKETTGNML